MTSSLAFPELKRAHSGGQVTGDHRLGEFYRCSTLHAVPNHSFKLQNPVFG